MPKYVLAWFPMVLIAILNGVARETWLGPHMGELLAHQVSSLTFLILFGTYTSVLLRRWPPGSGTRAVAIGLMWLGMTVAFEFLFGHYVAGHAWARLLRDYDLLAGRLWVPVLLGIAAAPYLFHRIRQRPG